MGAVVTGPWLFGAYESWAYLLLCLVIMFAAGCWLMQTTIQPRARLRFPLTAAALALLALLLIIQMAPMPAGLVNMFNASAAKAHSEQAQLFQSMHMSEFLQGAVGSGGAMTLSAAPRGTLRTFFIFAAFTAVFLVSANAFRRWRHVQASLLVLTISGFIMALVGIIHEFSGSPEVLWFHQTHYGGAIFGPYANPNHYATCMNLLFGVAVGLLLAEMRRSPVNELDSLREKVAWISSGKANRIALIAFAAAIMGASVLVSLSRGGIVSLIMAAGVLVLWFGLKRSQTGVRVGGIIMLVVGITAWIGWEPVLSEIATLSKVNPRTEGRTIASLTAVKMFEAAPLAGHGFGSFQHVFPVFRPERLKGARWVHAHNEYAQLLAEGGIAGIFVVGLIVLAFLRETRSKWEKATERGKLLATGLSVGFVATILHSGLGFGLRSPATFLVLAAAGGLCSAGLSLRKQKNKQHTGTNNSE